TNASPFTSPSSVSDQSPSSAIAKVELYVKGPLDAVYSLAAPADTSGNASGSFSYPPGGEATYSFYTLATDKAGNAESPPSSADVQVTVLYDTTAPSSSILCNSTTCASGYYNADVTVTLNGSDTGGSGLKEIRYTIDGTAPTATHGTAIASGGTFTVSSTTTVKFVAVDNAGNVESPVNSQTISIDKVAPTVQSISRVDTNTTNASAVHWTVKFSKNVSGVDATDFSLVNGVLGGSPAITGVASAGDSYTVT